MEYPLIPFDDVNGKNIPNPRSIIQVAISDCLAKGDMTERDIAIHVCNSLHAFMSYMDCSIKSIERAETDFLIFK